MADLLVEIGTEELPARRVWRAAEALRDGLAAALAEAGLLDGWDPEGKAVLGTPRRLAALVPGVKERQADREERAWGPIVSAATGPDGKPTKAGEGFARSAGVAFADLRQGEKVPGKPPYLYADRKVKGRAAAEVIAEALPKVVAALPFQRTMRWPESPTPFARPIRNLVVLLGDAVVPCRVAGVEAGRTTRGHAFLAPKPFEVARADLAKYVEALRQAKVLVDFAERTKEIRKQVEAARAEVLGAGAKETWSVVDDSELLAEVAGLVEWPRALVGSFDARYRDLPPSLLVTAMAHHLRYFPVLGPDGNPLDRFVSVTDREEKHAASIREGNERVLRARLYDAAFFFANDRKRKLGEFRPALSGVDFHKGLGTLLDKSERVRRSAVSLCDTLKLPAEARAHADRAAFLLKCDLLTEVVKEFPELQGSIGAHYARTDGEAAGVAAALEAQYLTHGPRLRVVAGKDPAAAAVVIAERSDTLAAYFSIGEEPTGSADPFGMRRAALALLQAVDATPLSIDAALAPALAEWKLAPEAAARLRAFLWARVEQMAREEGFGDFLDGFGPRTDLPLGDFRSRLDALGRSSRAETWRALVALVERTGNMGAAAADGAAARASLPPEAEALRGSVAGFAGATGEGPPGGAEGHLRFARRYLDAFGRGVDALFEKVMVDDPKKPEQSAAIKDLLYQIFVLFRDRLGDLRRLGSGARPPRA